MSGSLAWLKFRLVRFLSKSYREKTKLDVLFWTDDRTAIKNGIFCEARFSLAAKVEHTLSFLQVVILVATSFNSPRVKGMVPRAPNSWRKLTARATYICPNETWWNPLPRKFLEGYAPPETKRVFLPCSRVMGGSFFSVAAAMHLPLGSLCLFAARGIDRMFFRGRSIMNML